MQPAPGPRMRRILRSRSLLRKPSTRGLGPYCLIEFGFCQNALLKIASIRVSPNLDWRSPGQALGVDADEDKQAPSPLERVEDKLQGG